MFESAMKPVWWLPSFGLFLFLAIELWMFVSPDRIFTDPGVGRHLRTAEFILESGQIPRADPLSFNRAGQPWNDFEWAFEATIGELYRAGGLALVCAFCHAIFAATILGLYRTLLQSGLSLSVVMLSTGIAFLTVQIHFSARPLLFTYLFMALVVEVWRRRTQPLLRDWLILPVVFAAWANLHAGWLAGLLFLALSIFGRGLDRISGRVDGDEAPLIPWIGLTLLCALATALNPWGWDLHRHAFLMATTLKSAARWIEYLPPDFAAPSMSAITVMLILAVVFMARVSKGAPLWRWATILPVLFFLYEGLKTQQHLLVVVLFILMVLYMARASKRELLWRWETVLPVLLFLYEGLKAQRHVILLMEIAAVPVARDLEVVLHGAWWPHLRGLMRSFQAKQRLAGGDAWLALVAALALAALFVRSPLGRNIQVGENVTPRLVAFLRDHPDRFHRPLTTTWNAGPLLWNMRPDFRVSFDDRGEFYGDDTVFSFIDMMNGSAGWEEKLKQGNYDSLFLDPYLQLNQLLHRLPEWKEVYRDEHVVVYWRDEN